MLKGAEPIEIATLVASALDLFFDHGGGMKGRMKSFFDSGGAKIIGQQMPKMFGIGFTENSLTASLLAKLGNEKAMKLERMLRAMTDYERYFFWMTLTSIKVIPSTTTKVTRKDGGKKLDDATPEEVVEQTLTKADVDDRLQTLEFIIAHIDDASDRDMRAKVDSLYTLRIMEESAWGKAWGLFSKSFKQGVLDPLGVASVKEILSSPRIKAWAEARSASRKKPVPMNIFERIGNASLSGAKPVPEPLNSIGAILRTFGIPIPVKNRRTK